MIVGGYVEREVFPSEQPGKAKAGNKVRKEAFTN